MGPREIARKIRNRILMAGAEGSPVWKLHKLYAHGARAGELKQRAALAAQIPPERRNLPVVSGLQTEGYAPVTDLDGFDGLLQALAPRLSQVDANGVPGTIFPGPDRDYFRIVVGSEEPKFASDPLVQFALQPKVLEPLTAYFGYVPVLEYVEVIVSIASVANPGKWAESQLWHRDFVDTRNPKLFVYLSDVNSANEGPFTFIPAPVSRKVRNKLVPRRITDDQMRSQGYIQNARQILGKKGTAFFCDTGRCYHLGSRCKNARIAYMASFVSPTPLKPLKSAVKADVDLDPMKRLALRER